MTSTDVLNALRLRHDQPHWTFLEELPLGDVGNWRIIDAFALSYRYSDHYRRVAYEIKVSRSDFARELADPSKRAPALAVSNQFFFAAPKGLIRPEELPPECGLIEVNGEGRARVRVQSPFREQKMVPAALLALVASFVAAQPRSAAPQI